MVERPHMFLWTLPPYLLHNIPSATNSSADLHLSPLLPAMKPTTSNLVVTDASFSSYLKPSEPEEHPTTADAELGIFDARKYFNEGVTVSNEQTTTLSSSKRVSPIKDGNLNLNRTSDPSFSPRFSSASSFDGYGQAYRNRSMASSEASWNSHTGLLGPNSDPRRDIVRGGGGSSSRKSNVPRWLLFHSCKCPCSGKNSVRVKEKTIKTMKKEDSTLPDNPNPSRDNTVSADQRNYFRVSLNMDSRHVLVSAPPKPSTDAASVTVTATSGFTFPILNPAITPPMKTLYDRQAIKTSASTATVHVESDDAASDASSDLFEIESITTQSTYPITTHNRDSLDEAIPRPSNSVPEVAKLGSKMGTDCHSSLSAPEFERFPRIDLGRSARIIMGGADCDGNSRLRGSGLLSCRT